MQKEKWIFIINPIAGNGFAKTLAPEIEKMIKKHNIDGEVVFTDRFEEKDYNILFEKNVIAMDVGKVNNMIFLNGMGLGFDAQVAAENYDESGRVQKGGVNKYIWHIIKTLFFFREKRMYIRSADEKHETDCFI